MNISTEQISISTEQYLEQFKKQHGEEAWRSEVKRLASQAFQAGPKHEAFWRELTKGCDWLNWDALKQETEKSGQVMANLLKEQMPGVKSQAQYNSILGAFEAVKIALNAILTGDAVQEAEARKALEMAFEAATKSTEITNKLEEVPEAVISESAKEFKNPPTQFHEYDLQRQLLLELEPISNILELNSWYSKTKKQRDSILTQGFRNTLMDAIRIKKDKLEGALKSNE